MAKTSRNEPAPASTLPASEPADLSRFQKRREPRQARARFTVGSIKQATLELAMERGFRSLTTEQIAERAGVNIGSLYQYFPNREAILLSVYEEASSQLLEKMKTLTVDIFDTPMDKAAFQAMDRLLATFEKNQLILLQLVAEMPELNTAARPTSYESLSRGTIRNFIQHRMTRGKPRDINRRAFFIEHIALGCIQNYLLDRPPGLSRKEFLNDLAWILTAYIGKPG